MVPQNYSATNKPEAITKGKAVLPTDDPATRTLSAKDSRASDKGPQEASHESQEKSKPTE